MGQFGDYGFGSLAEQEAIRAQVEAKHGDLNPGLSPEKQSFLEKLSNTVNYQRAQKANANAEWRENAKKWGEPAPEVSPDNAPLGIVPNEARNIHELTYRSKTAAELAEYAEKTNAKTTSEQQARAHVDQLNSKPNQPAALEPDFDPVEFSDALGLPTFQVASMGITRAEDAVKHARSAVQGMLDKVDNSEFYEWLGGAPGDDPLRISQLVGNELGKLAHPKYGLPGERSQAQQTACDAITRLVHRQSMAATKTKTVHPALPTLVRRAVLVDDPHFSAGKKNAKRPVQAPTNGFRSIHDLVKNSPFGR